MRAWNLLSSGVLWSGLWRKPARTLLTAASLATAFALLGLLGPILLLFKGGAQEASSNLRLVVQPRHSIADFLPERHAAAVARIPGVAGTAHLTWFGGVYRDPGNAFPRWAVPHSAFLALVPSMILPADARQAFRSTRTGAIVGRRTASRFGLKVGDLITLVPDIWPNRDGRPWTFEIVGVFDSADANVDLTAMYFHYDYFDTYRAWGRGQISYVVASLKSGLNPADVASRIDARFADSADETVTSTERAYVLSFANRLGDVGLMLSVVLAAVLFSIAIVCAQTMSQSVRERTAEWGVLRALGFQRAHVVWLVLMETLAIILLGALPGLLCAQLILFAARSALGSLVVSLLEPTTLAIAGLVIALLALLAGFAPARRVQRLRIVEALRRA